MARRRRDHGSIRKLRSGRYQARVWDENHGRHRAAPQTFPTRAAAAGWLAEARSGLAWPSAPLSSSELTLERFATDWVQTRGLSPRTLALYQSQLRRHIVPAFGDLPLDGIEPASVRAWYSQLLDSGLSQVTAAKLYRLLRAVLATALDEGLIPANPCRIKGAGVERSPERPIPTLVDVARLAEGLPENLAAVPWLAALAGLRRGEIFALARLHLDLDQGLIRVERSIQEIKGQGSVFLPPKSSAGNRRVVAPPTLVGLLDSHLENCVAPDADALLFTNAAGRPVRASVWTPAWASANQSAGTQIRLHDLRHLAGTLTAQAGATLRETMDRLGHSSPQAALRYQHVAHSRPRRIAEAIEGIVAEDLSSTE